MDNTGRRFCNRPVRVHFSGFVRCLGAGAVLAGFLAATGPARPGHAACNLIPQTTQTFDSVLGATNRPFAGPGEPIELHVRPCDTSSAGISATATDQLVTVLFTPNGGGTRNAVVLTAAADCSAVTPLLAACHAQLGAGATATCVSGAAAGLNTVARPDGTHLQFLFPDTDSLVGSPGDGLTLAGPATIAVTQATAALPCGLSTATCSAQAPSIAGLVACIDDFFTDDGSCGTSQPQGIFNHFTALPYPNDFAGACVSEAPPCNPTATQFRLTADQRGNALMPMDWRGILVRPGGVPFPRLLSASLSTPIPVTLPGQSFFSSFSPDGGPLAPIFVPQFDPTSSSTVLSLFGSADAPYTVLRIARRSDNFEQCHGGVNDGLPCNGADDCPALCSGGSNAGQRCTGDAQCPGGTCSAPSAGSCEATVCVGGSKAGQACTADSSCPGGECGPAVFTLTPLIYAGNGPVVLPRQPGVCASGTNSGGACTTMGDCPGSFCLTSGFCQEDTSHTCSLTSACSSVPCVDFQLTAENPIPLASLVAQGPAAQSQKVFALTSAEAVDLVDRNGDGDTTDVVVTLRDRTTGTLQPLGAPAQCIGRSTPTPTPVPVPTGGPTPFVPYTGRSTLTSTPVPEGRAVVQLSEPPFLFPAVATAGDLVAFLESEPGEGYCDENSNGAVFDSILRVFRLGPTDLTAGLDETVDAAPVLNAQSVVISNDQVFFRQSEAARAQQQTTRASVDSANTQGNSVSETASISADGRYVAFTSYASNLVSVDTNGTWDVFVHDRQTGVTERVSVGSAGTEGNGISGSPSISADGRYVAFHSDATNLVADDTNGTRDVFVRDRCVSNGSPVPSCTPATERVSADSSGVQGDGVSDLAAISADGRYVAFESRADNLVPGDTNGANDVFVHDRQTGVTERVSVGSTGTEGNGECSYPSISADGRYVAFDSDATNLVPGDTNGSGDVFVHDRQTGVTERVSVDSAGTQGNGESGVESVPISADGRYVAFYSYASNLVPGDTNGVPDVFVHDRLTGGTERVSVDSAGTQGNGWSVHASISADGRYVAFDSDATNLVPGDTNGYRDVFVHDRLTGVTERVSVDSTGSQGDGHSDPFYSPSISADGRYVAFESDATNLDLVLGDTNGYRDVFVHGPDPNDTASDLTGDGDMNDTVLAVLDTTQSSPSPVSLCPADLVSVAGGAAAFLRPESAGLTPNLPNCPAGTAVSGGVDLNGNGTATDEVAHLALNSSTILNLGVAGTAVSLSGTCSGGANANAPCVDNADCPGGTCAPSVVAALVSEAGQNTDLNGDGDTTDTVVEVHPAASGSWSNVGQAADTVQVEGNLVAFLTPEAAQGNTDLNRDGDTLDRVLQVYDAATAKLTNVKQAAEEFVMGTQPASCGSGPVIAFRTSEAAQGNTDLNGDGDTSDDVLQVYVPGVGVTNTREAVTRCNIEACNPRQPYLVQGDTVKFLTYEGDQNQDLNGDGTTTDLILQIFDACRGTLTTAGAVDTSNGGANPLTNGGTPAQAVLATTAGVCVSGMTTLLVPAMCATDADCPIGATCLPGNSIVAAPAAIPTHYDTVVTAPKPLTVVIPAGQSSVTASLKIKVANGDVRPAKAKPGHTVQLRVDDGTCPAGTVAGLPGLNLKTTGAQDTILLKGGAAKSARVPLRITRDAFATANRRAPYRCTLAVSVAAPGGDGNIDPTPANNSAAVELNVIDLNNPQPSTAGDAVITSVKPVKLAISKRAASISKTHSVPVRLLNADTVPATLTVTASDGTCPSGTVVMQAPAVTTVAGGKTGQVKVQITATNAAFLTANGKSPARCTASLTVSGSGSDPDPTNNAAQVLIDVVDKEDY